MAKAVFLTRCTDCERVAISNFHCFELQTAPTMMRIVRGIIPRHCFNHDFLCCGDHGLFFCVGVGIHRHFVVLRERYLFKNEP